MQRTALRAAADAERFDHINEDDDRGRPYGDEVIAAADPPFEYHFRL